MRLIELGGEQQFSEGEPDLEPPEEAALGEIDDEALLGERLENDDLSEEDVDDELLSWTLEDLVHVDDDLDEAGGAGEDADDADEEDLVGTLEVEDIEDLEESLDLLLALRLAATPAGDASAGDGSAEDDGGATPPAGADGGSARLACGPEEFVCRGCFLVHHRSQLVEEGALVCRDCAG